jgi:rod shape-determining protein MreD
MDSAARRAVPFALTLFLMLFALTPTYVPGLSDVAPMLTLMCVYFWSIYRPDLLGYGAAFGIGVLEDFLVGTPLGSGALVLLLCQRIVVHQHKFLNSRPFVVTWAAFAVVAMGAALVRWLCVGLVATGGFAPIGGLLAVYLMSVSTYPLVVWLLAKAQMKFLAET